jgi:ATP/maltotriose-dependent transcriptional regulator MalT
MLARVLWLRGFIDQAGKVARAALEQAQATNHNITVCATLRLAVCPITLLTGDLVAASRAVKMMIKFVEYHNATFWRVLTQCMEGALLVKCGEFAAGLATLRSAREICSQTGWAMFSLEFLGMLSEGLMGLHQFGVALTAIDEAPAKAQSGGERWYVPELLRIRGEVLRRGSEDRESRAAEDCFEQALRLAGEQAALFWELRIALSMAQLRMDQDRLEEARSVLAPVYDR